MWIRGSIIMLPTEPAQEASSLHPWLKPLPQLPVSFVDAPLQIKGSGTQMASSSNCLSGFVELVACPCSRAASIWGWLFFTSLSSRDMQITRMPSSS